MRDMATKMAELKFEAPLAQFEETEDWGIIDFHHQNTGAATTMSSVAAENNLTTQDAKNSNNLEPLCASTMSSNLSVMANNTSATLDNAATLPLQLANSPQVTPITDSMSTLTVTSTLPHDNVSDNFTETFSGSLEDLVNTFDDKITKCFCNYDESVEKLAPVQVRTQEEIMNECQMWWTITGNFGNILPIDWSKSYARKFHMPALNLNGNTTPVSASTTAAATPTVPDGDRLDDPLEPSSEDEAVANDLDLHSLILGGGLHAAHEPPIKTADEVIREIDDMMQDADEADCSPDGCSSVDGSSSLLESSAAEAKAAAFLHSPLYEDKLKRLSVSELNEVYLELEVLIREFSETLIAELALRDELEYEKELKNSFISLLLSVQNRRRQYHVEKKRRTHSGLDPKYLTTVIPYHLGSGPPDNQALQVLIKILKAINEDSPTVPTLLTDYILKVLCPT